MRQCVTETHGENPQQDCVQDHNHCQAKRAMSKHARQNEVSKRTELPGTGELIN